MDTKTDRMETGIYHEMELLLDEAMYARTNRGIEGNKTAYDFWEGRCSALLEALTLLESHGLKYQADNHPGVTIPKDVFDMINRI